MISQADLLQQYRVFITQNNVTDLEAAIHLARWVEQLHDDDAKLGALVRAMPEGYKLWYRNHHNVWEVRINQELVSAGDTPEDALKSAGVSLGDVA